MKRKIIYSVNKGILLLLAFGALAAVAVMAPNALQIIKLFQKRDPRLRKYRPNSIRKSFRRLEDQKLISIQEENGQLIIRLTEKGRTRALKYKIEDMKIPVPKIWDKKWRLVMFDIPNRKTLARDVLRDKLKELGFYKLQKSIWIYPYECKNEIDFIKEIYEVSPYVKMAVVEKIDDEEKYLSFFNLKSS
jgi:CRISPR-associated endonuclease Cas2